MSSFILITGMPGCGKTTMVRKLIGEIKRHSKSVNLQGFYTEEVRNTNNERVGFDVVTLDGKRGPLARVSSKISSSDRPATGSTYKVGSYIVYVREFESIAMSSLETSTSTENTLLVIDEIGKMELFSDHFSKFVANLIKSNRSLKVLATVPLKNSADLVTQLKNHKFSQLHHITKANREEIYPEILESVMKLVY